MHMFLTLFVKQSINPRCDIRRWEQAVIVRKIYMSYTYQTATRTCTSMVNREQQFFLCQGQFIKPENLKAKDSHSNSN